MAEVTVNNVPVIITIIAFFIVSLVIGLSSTKKASKGFLSFMIADKSLPWWAIAGTAYATYAGTITYLAWVGSSGKMGFSAGWQFIIHATGFMMMGTFLVPILCRMKRVTLSEPLGERFDGSLRRISSLISFFALIGNNASQILGLGVILSMFSSLTLVQACILATVCLILYVGAGGMYGVAFADTFQGIIMILFTIVAPIVLLAVIGGGDLGSGFNTVWNALPTKNLSMVNTNPNQLITWLLIMPFTNLLRPELYGRIFAAKNGKEAVKGWTVATAAVVLTMIPVLIMGMCCKFALPEFEGGGDAYAPAMFSAIAPPWLTVFFVLVVVAAAVSTASSQMMGYSGHYMTDFHIPLFYKNKTPDEKTLVRVSRISIVVFTAIALYWAIAWQNLLNIWTFCFTVMVCGTLMPYIGMFFWPRMTTMGARCASIGGAGVAIIWKFVLQKLGLFAGLDAAIPAFITTVALGVIVSLCGKPEYEKALNFAKVYKLDKMQKWAENGLNKIGSGK